MPTTPNRQYPYPDLQYVPDVPADLKRLAEALDADMTAVAGAVPGQSDIPEIFYGTGAPPTAGMKAGDIYAKFA
jgi:hypothetical protein